MTRFQQNPLITVATSQTLGGNVNGPTVIQVPDWVDRPLGRYYFRCRQIRDPFVFDEHGRAVLFYTTCGEQGIAAADLALP